MNKLEKIIEILRILRLLDIAIYLLSGVYLIIWKTYELLTPTSRFYLSKYYKKKRPDILTVGVTCIDRYTGNSNYLAIMEEHSFDPTTPSPSLSNPINFIEQYIFPISGSLIRFPILYFNHKIVSRSLDGRLPSELLDMGLPVDPIELAKLEIKTFHEESWGGNWIIYVDPAKFTHREYRQIICCYETHRKEIDSTLANSKFTPWWTQKVKPPRSFSFNSYANRISHIVYGAMPQPRIFSPPKISKGYVLEGKWIPIYSEELIIYHNFKWQINIRRKHRINQWKDWTIGRGSVRFAYEKKVKILDVDNLSFPSLDSIKDISVQEYFASLVDSQGNKLTDFCYLGNIPSKFNYIRSLSANS